MSSSESNRPDTQLEELLRRAEAQQQEAEDCFAKPKNSESSDSAIYPYGEETNVSSEGELQEGGGEQDWDEDEYEGEADFEDDILAEEEGDALDNPHSTPMAEQKKGADRGSNNNPFLSNEALDRQWERFMQTPKHRLWFIPFVVVLVMLSAFWNTHYNTVLRQVSEQEEVLTDLRYRSLFTTAELVHIERISSVEKRIKELNLPLEHSTQPPYEIVVTAQAPSNP